MAILFIGAVVLGTPTPATNISFSSGFTDHMVLQRGAMSNVYGFAPTAHPVMVRVLGVDAAGAKVSYVLAATVAPQTAQGFYPRGAPPVHGAFTWRVALRAATGGVYTITANDGSQNASLSDCVIGDVYFCSGQSNMALETFYTFSADTLKAEVRAGKWRNIRHFMFGSMGGQYLATEPQWVSSLQTNDGDPLSTNSWHTLEVSAARPSLNNATGAHSAFAQFSATCMYFAVELVRATGDTTTPIGVIQSAIGGSQIESWMDNTTLTECANESLTGGAVPEDSGRLFYGMVAPFVNTSVSGWLWYQVCVGVSPVGLVAARTMRPRPDSLFSSSSSFSSSSLTAG
jgi:sialate O-acetylesterase